MFTGSNVRKSGDLRVKGEKRKEVKGKTKAFGGYALVFMVVRLTFRVWLFACP
jgi:hypothetical protein